jgi:hypothetical protein
VMADEARPHFCVDRMHLQSYREDLGRCHRASLRSLARRGALEPTLSEQRYQLLSTTGKSIAHVSRGRRVRLEVTR